jgi:hypothetical protein
MTVLQVFRAAKEKDEDIARKRSCVTPSSASSTTTPRFSRFMPFNRVFVFRYKVVVDLHAKFAGLCKAVEEEGQVSQRSSPPSVTIPQLLSPPSVTIPQLLMPSPPQVQNTLRQLEAQVEAAVARGAALNVPTPSLSSHLRSCKCVLNEGCRAGGTSRGGLEAGKAGQRSALKTSRVRNIESPPSHPPCTGTCVNISCGVLYRMITTRSKGQQGRVVRFVA